MPVFCVICPGGYVNTVREGIPKIHYTAMSPERSTPLIISSLVSRVSTTIQLRSHRLFRTMWLLQGGGHGLRNQGVPREAILVDPKEEKPFFTEELFDGFTAQGLWFRLQGLGLRVSEQRKRFPRWAYGLRITADRVLRN